MVVTKVRGGGASGVTLRLEGAECKNAKDLRTKFFAEIFPTNLAWLITRPDHPHLTSLQSTPSRNRSRTSSRSLLSSRRPTPHHAHSRLLARRKPMTALT